MELNDKEVNNVLGQHEECCEKRILVLIQV